MSGTEALLDQVVARLRAKFTTPKLEVIKWPENPKIEPNFAGGIAAMWIGYEGSRSTGPEATDFPVQRRTRRISVAVFTRQLNGVHGAASYVDAVNEVLHGWRPADGERLWLSEDAFGAAKNGIWRYDLVYHAACIAVPLLDSDSDTPGPALRRVIYADELGGDSQIDLPQPPQGT